MRLVVESGSSYRSIESSTIRGHPYSNLFTLPRSLCLFFSCPDVQHQQHSGFASLCFSKEHIIPCTLLTLHNSLKGVGAGVGCSRKPSSLEVYCLKQAQLFPRIRDLTKQRGIWARTHKISICVPEKKFVLSFQIFVINDFSKCEVESEWRCSVGSSKKASNYLSRISRWRIRRITSTEWFHWDAL